MHIPPTGTSYLTFCPPSMTMYFLWLEKGIKSILPIPPFELLLIMLLRIHEIHGTAEDIEHTSVDMLTAELLEFLIQSLRILAFQTTRAVDTDVSQILRDALSHPGNAFQIS